MVVFDDSGASASTSFILICAALVFIMTPGVGLFYAGLVRSRNALTLITVCFLCSAVVTIQWFLFGYSLTFSESGGPFIGDFTHGALSKVGVNANSVAPNIPSNVFVLYQLMFASVTPAVIFGSVAERIRIVPAMIFIFVWTTLVYDFVTYWTWGAHGWLKHLSCLRTLNCGVGAIDYAGGGPIHVSSGFAGLAFTLFLGKNEKRPPRPHNVTMVYLGTILLWFGWFGFNGGSALASNPRAASSALITTTAASFGAISWIVIDYFMGIKKVTGVGFCSGVLAGLATVTPASGFIAPWAGAVIGILGGVICNFAVRVKEKLGYDDALDAFGLHGIGGFFGVIFTGIFHQGFISELDGGSSDGGAIEGNGILVAYQLALAFSIAAYSFAVTYIILLVMKYIPGIKFTVTDKHNRRGMDLEETGEVAYAYAIGRESIISFSTSSLAKGGNTVHVEPVINEEESPMIPAALEKEEPEGTVEEKGEEKVEN